MISKSTLIHLRIPFSYFLMPVFFLSISLSAKLDISRTILAFFILHLFLYPASNSFNSYYDRDTGSIGGLKHPPQVEKDLIFVSLVFDLIAVLLGFLIDWIFALAVFAYGLASKVYSFDKIRLKKYPVISWLGTGIIQGGFTFLTVYYAANGRNFGSLFKTEIIIPAVLCSAFLLASYPMTQIYQHDEDGQRGDITISILLGIKGTFKFTSFFFALVTAGFFIFYNYYFGLLYAVMFIIFQIPVFIYFIIWMARTFKDNSKADYTSTMLLNFMSSTFMNLFCLLFIFIKK